jgi:hypothetical protein
MLASNLDRLPDIAGQVEVHFPRASIHLSAKLANLAFSLFSALTAGWKINL